MFRLAFAQGFAQVGFHAWIATLPVAMAAVGRPDGAIGAVVGMAAIFSLVAALGTGPLVDRFGGRAVYLLGSACYLAAAAPIALGLVRPDSPFEVLLLIRLLQGCGLAAVIPSVMTLVPGTVSRQRLPMAVGVVGLAGNVSLALTPAVSLFVMEAAGFAAVGLLASVVVTAGMALIWPVRDPSRVGRIAPRRWRPAWRPEWARPLLAGVLITVNWGILTGYLPQRAVSAGADVGLFFTFDALALVALRLPVGWMAGRISPVPLLVVGALLTAASISLLLLPVSDLLLIVSGVGTGAGSASVFPVLNLEMNERSDPVDRGSAFGWYSMAFGAGVALGSLGIAPLYGAIGFEVAMLIGVVTAASVAAVAVLDPRMRHPPIGQVAPAAASSVTAAQTAAGEPAGLDR